MIESFFDLPSYTLVFLCFAALFAGFIDSVAGGGGLISLPSIFLAGIPAQFALATNKFMAIFGTATATINFMRDRKIIWRIAIIGLIFSLMGSVVGTKVILLFDDKTITSIVLAILPFTAVAFLLPKKKLKTETSEFTNIELYLLVPLVSFLLGFYDGFFGPGTGTFLIIAFYYVIGLNLVNASAVAKVINLASGVGSCITFAIAGKVLYSVAFPLIICNIIGGFIGSKMAIKKGQSFVRFIMIFVFIVLFVSLTVRYFNH